MVSNVVCKTFKIPKEGGGGGLICVFIHSECGWHLHLLFCGEAVATKVKSAKITLVLFLFYFNGLQNF
jgi:hypothetical protein